MYLGLGFIFAIFLFFKSQRNVNYMLSKNKTFWDDDVLFPKPFEGEVLAPANVPEGFGFVDAPMEVDPDTYSNLTAVQRLRYRVKLADKHELRALLEAAIIKFKEAGLEDDAFVIKQLKNNPSELAAKLRPAIENPDLLEQNEPLSPAQALAMLLDVGLSEEDYNKMCKIFNTTHRILPPLYTIRKEKHKAHPDGIEVIDDVEVKVGFMVKVSCFSVQNSAHIVSPIIDKTDDSNSYCRGFGWMCSSTWCFFQLFSP